MRRPQSGPAKNYVFSNKKGFSAYGEIPGRKLYDLVGRTTVNRRLNAGASVLRSIAVGRRVDRRAHRGAIRNPADRVQSRVPEGTSIGRHDAGIDSGGGRSRQKQKK